MHYTSLAISDPAKLLFGQAHHEKLAIEDEKRFMDFSRCVMMATKERVFVDT